MLVLSRKQGQRLHLGEGIVLTVLGLKGGQVRLGSKPPKTW
jgi:carbon storage regulator CsrA